MKAPRVVFGQGFAGFGITEKYDTKTSTIGGKKVTEKQGKLDADLGKPAMSATEAELQSYIDAAKGPAEKKKRVARVNLMKGHKKGLKAKGSRVPSPRKGKGKVASDGVIRSPRPVMEAVVKPKYR